jgi:hypothetical protein
MGTHCYIGIEEQDGTVEYIYVHWDGYFSNIVPILREYTNREDVKKMIARGSDATLLLSEVQKNEPHTVLPENRPQRISSMYALLDARPRVGYIYVFTRDNEWICHTISFYFSMKSLKYYDKNYVSNGYEDE